MIQEVYAAATPIVVNLQGIGTNVGVATSAPVGVVIGNVIKIVMLIAMIAVLAMLIFGAFQWIISGGEKEAVANARNRITHALIGLAILGLSFVILTVVGNIIGINIFNNISIPTLTTPMPEVTNNNGASNNASP
jgi:hypothetical protein